jgi:hypothetical protein
VSTRRRWPRAGAVVGRYQAIRPPQARGAIANRGDNSGGTVRYVAARMVKNVAQGVGSGRLSDRARSDAKPLNTSGSAGSTENIAGCGPKAGA